MNTYTPTGAITQVSPTVWSFPTATGTKYFTPGIEGWGVNGSEMMPLRAGGGGNSTQIPWEIANKGEMGRFGGGSLGFAGENAANNEGGSTLQPGWFFDTNPGSATYKYSTGGSFLGDVLGNFMSGPGIPLGGFLGAGALGSGGLGNFLGSFGNGAASAAGGAMDMGIGLNDVFGFGDAPWGVNPQSGGNMFDPLADFGGDYFSGASDYVGNGLSSADLAGIDNWLANEGNFANDILGTGPRLPNGTPVDLFLANTAKTLGLNPTSLAQLFKDNGGFSKGLGGLLAAGLGAYGSNQQAKSLTDIANQARADRQPFLNASLSYLSNPDSFFAGPGKSAMDATLRGLSASVGNPIGSPTAMGIATEAGLKDWRNAVTGFGNMGLAGQDTRASLQAQAAQADAGSLNALGYGLNSVLNPQPSLTDVVKALNLGGLA